jgi:hypothetical protein
MPFGHLLLGARSITRWWESTRRTARFPGLWEEGWTTNSANDSGCGSFRLICYALTALTPGITGPESEQGWCISLENARTVPCGGRKVAKPGRVHNGPSFFLCQF